MKGLRLIRASAGARSVAPATPALEARDLARLCLQNLAANEADRVFFKDREGRFLMVSEGWLLAAGGGRSHDEIVGRTDHDFFGAEHAEAARADELRVMRTGRPLVAKLEVEDYHDRPQALVSTSKLPLRDARGEVVGIYGISRDITDDVSERAAAFHARRDPVTHLLTRCAFLDQAAVALARRSDRRGRPAMIVVNLDGFRHVNEMLGRELGDELLREFARRLHAAARDADGVARFGADQFAVLCASVATVPEAHGIAEHIRTAVRGPLLGPRDILLDTTAGVALGADGHEDPGIVLTRAEAALHRAKTLGGGRSEVFTQAASASGLGALSEELWLAIERSQLFLQYQPVISLHDGQVAGVETLVRWHHPSQGVLGPAHFIPIAERRGVIEQIDAYVLRAACRQLAAWQRHDPVWRTRSVAVNLSAAGLRHEDLVPTVLSTIRDTGIDASQLCLEVTETAMIDDLDTARRAINELTDHGVKVALDDFGTGFSNLSHLQHLCAGELKIDQSFIARLTGRRRDREIVMAVCAMARALNMSVVAEGVETREHHQLLTELGCDKAQGFFYARPVEAGELEHTIVNIQARASSVAHIHSANRQLGLPEGERQPGISSAARPTTITFRDVA